MKLRLEIEPLAGGTKIPFGYGIAWRDIDRFSLICYPMPLNLILGKLRDLYYIFKYRDGNIDKVNARVRKIVISDFMERHVKAVAKHGRSEFAYGDKEYELLPNSNRWNPEMHGIK